MTVGRGDVLTGETADEELVGFGKAQSHCGLGLLAEANLERGGNTYGDQTKHDEID